MSLEETSRYDRQIRLWGKSAQLQLMKTCVFFHQILGVSSEIALNVVLSGVHSVFIDDPTLPSPHDLMSNFLLRTTAAEIDSTSIKGASDERVISVLKQLNPLVKVVKGTLKNMERQAIVSSLRTVYIGSINTASGISGLLQRKHSFDLLVLLHEIDDDLVSFFFYSQCDADFIQQEENLFHPNFMHLRPGRVQKAILSLFLLDFLKENPEVSFLDRTIFLINTAEKLRTNSVTNEDIEDLCNQIKGNPLDCSSCTASGAAIAEHVLRHIVEDKNTSSFKWLLFDSHSESINLGN